MKKNISKTIALIVSSQLICDCICGCSNKAISKISNTQTETKQSIFVSEFSSNNDTATDIYNDIRDISDTALRFVAVENYGIVRNIWELSYSEDSNPCYHFEYRHSSSVIFSTDVEKERGDRVFDMFRSMDKNYPERDDIDKLTGSYFGYIDDENRYPCSLSPDDYNAILDEMLSIKEEAEARSGNGKG